MKITRSRLRHIIKEELSSFRQCSILRESEDELWGNPSGVWDRSQTVTGRNRLQFNDRERKLLKKVPYSPDVWNLSSDSPDTSARGAWLKSAEQGDITHLTKSLDYLYDLRDNIEMAHFSKVRRGMGFLDSLDDWTTPIAVVRSIASRNPVPVLVDLVGDSFRKLVQINDRETVNKLAQKLSNVQYGILRLETAYRQKESDSTNI